MAEYAFITLDDGAQISHSEMLADHRVKVYFRRDELHMPSSCSPSRHGWMPWD